MRRLLVSTVLFVAWPVLAGAQSLDVLHHFSGRAFSDGPGAALLVAADGHLYGTTVGGGTYNKGSIFRMTPAGDVTLLHSFAGGADGSGPEAALIQAFDGRFYGTTRFGGTFDRGTAFRMEPDGAVTILHSFGGPGDCAIPTVLLQATDGDFYGVASYAFEANFIAAIFKMTADGTVTIVYGTPVFPGTLGIPVGLIQASDGNFIGTTQPRVVGGPYDWGTVFRLTPDGTLTVLHAFAIGAGNPYWPESGVIEASDGNFYGTTDSGGAHGQGTVYRMTSAGDVTVLHSFTGGVDGSRPRGLFETDGTIYGTTSEGLSGFEDGAVFKISPGGLFTLLHTFSGAPDGSHPYGGVVQTADGTLYGTTQKGGAADFGSVFTIDGSGAVSLLYEFGGDPEGASADSPLVQATDGHFYGATCAGGVSNRGTLFRTTRAGAFTVLYTFLGTTDGSCPQGLVQASDGLLYGTTLSAGEFGSGTLFRLTLGGVPTVLHAFGAGNDGRSPRWLIQANDGHLYGTTLAGGVPDRGTVFRMTLSGDYTVVHTFAGGTADGAYPSARLLQASDGQFYGSTTSGGISDRGTLFRMTSSGTVTLLHSFSGSSSDGFAPAGPLVEGAAGNLYGATSYRVSLTPNTYYFCNVFFRVSLAGEFQALPGTGSRCGGGFGTLLSYWLVAKRNGTLLGIETGPGSSIIEFPLNGPITLVHSMTTSEGTPVVAPLLEATDGQLYGVARSGGAFGGGTIFRLRYVPNAPEVLTVSSAGARVRLAWAPTAGAASYTVKRSSTSGAETTIASGLVGTEFVDTTVARGQTYYYIVTATNSFGESTATYEVSITPGRAIPGDFDGDGKTDIAVFRPSTGVWYIRQSSNAALAAITWGASTDILVPGDYDGDGQIDAAVFRPSTGVWYIRPSSTFSTTVITWGASTDIPVPGDYDGDGQTDAAVFRPSTGVWYIRQSRTFALLSILWGISTDTPVPGDYDGDGRTDVAVFRASTSMWYVRRSATATMAVSPLGSETDTPVAADYDGDGKADVGVFSPAANAWRMVQSGPGTEATIVWGGTLDVPVPGDYDGDGRADATVFRSSTGVWYVRLSSTGIMVSGPWGDPTDVPILTGP